MARRRHPHPIEHSLLMTATLCLLAVGAVMVFMIYTIMLLDDRDVDRVVAVDGRRIKGLPGFRGLVFSLQDVSQYVEELQSLFGYDVDGVASPAMMMAMCPGNLWGR